MFLPVVPRDAQDPVLVEHVPVSGGEGAGPRAALAPGANIVSKLHIIMIRKMMIILSLLLFSLLLL